MSSWPVAADVRRFDEELEAAIHGSGAVAGELAAARFLALGLAPLREVPAGVYERAWQKVQAQMAAPAPQRLAWPSLRRPCWAVSAVGLLLALSIAVMAIGPGRVWAEVQRRLGYVPGIGFVDPAHSRLLLAPVAVARGDVTVYVDQMVAGRERTVVLIRTEGLPPEGRGTTGHDATDDPWPRLRLPGGELLTASGGRLVYGAGTVTFAPLPENVSHVTLELTRLPLVPPGAAPEGWALPLVLRPALGEGAGEPLATAYAPEAASMSTGGVTLRVLDVAHTPQDTALRLQAAWQDAAWRLLEIGFAQRPELRDEEGRVYPTTFASADLAPITNAPGGRRFPWPLPVPPGPQGLQAEPAREETLTFTPVPVGARELTLSFDRLSFRVPVDASLTVDLGSDPQVGDSWPLDVDLQVAGFPVHIERAVLVTDPQVVDGRLERRRTLRFDISPMPEEEDSVVWGIELDGGSQFLADGTAGYIRDRRVNTMWTGLVVPEGEPIPQGVVQVQIKGAYVAVGGPWEVAWAVAGR